MKNVKEKIVLVILFLFLAGMIIYGVYTEISLLKKKTSYTKIEGRISSYTSTTETDSDGTSTTYYPVYSYRVQDIDYSIKGAGSSDAPKVGKIITIYYNPENIADAICEEDENTLARVLLSFGLGIMIFMFGFRVYIKSNAQWLMGLGFLVLGGGLMIAIPGFHIWKFVMAIFPLLGIACIMNDILNVTGLSKKYALWKSENYPEGYLKDANAQKVAGFFREDNRGERMIDAATKTVSIIRSIPLLIVGVVFVGVGALLVFFADFFGVIFLGAGVMAVVHAIRSIIDVVRN